MNLNQMNKHMVRKLNNHEAFPLHYPHLAPPVCMGCWTKFNSVSRLMKYKYKNNAIQLHIFTSRGAIQWVPGRVKHKAETAVAGLLRLKLGQPWIATTPCLLHIRVTLSIVLTTGQICSEPSKPRLTLKKKTWVRAVLSLPCKIVSFCGKKLIRKTRFY